MPADIVARARAAIRQANHPESELTVEPASRQVLPIGAPMDGVPAAAGYQADSEPSEVVAGEPEAAEKSDPLPETPTPVKLVVEPWEQPGEPQGAANLGVELPRWRGYNPDYVADQMVPMIHARATTGWRSWLGMEPSKSEQLRKQLQAEMCVNFGQPVKIVVANPRGSAGKTIMSVCLAGVLGVARGGGVCAFENHELRGVMGLRTLTNGTKRTTRDFINDLSQMTPEQVRQADLGRYVRHQHVGNFDAMVTSRSFEKQLDGDEYRAASALLERFYEVIVVDTANNEAHEAFQAAIADATVLVVPTKWRPTHITPAAQMLNDMAARSPRHRMLVQNAVVVATNGFNEAVPGAREMALPMFSSLAETVVEIPPDPHIDADRPILLDQLRPRTRRALDEFGAAVCRVAVKNLSALEELS
ncbi:MinD/ParA family ATP-binding protein [Microlunatus ginsengisoli]